MIKSNSRYKMRFIFVEYLMRWHWNNAVLYTSTLLSYNFLLSKMEEKKFTIFSPHEISKWNSFKEYYITAPTHILIDTFQIWHQINFGNSNYFQRLFFPCLDRKFLRNTLHFLLSRSIVVQCSVSVFNCKFVCHSSYVRSSYVYHCSDTNEIQSKEEKAKIFHVFIGTALILIFEFL